MAAPVAGRGRPAIPLPLPPTPLQFGIGGGRRCLGVDLDDQHLSIPVGGRGLLEPLRGVPPQAEDRLLDGHLRGGPEEEVHGERRRLVVADQSGEPGQEAQEVEAETVGGEPQGDIEGGYTPPPPSLRCR